MATEVKTRPDAPGRQPASIVFDGRPLSFATMVRVGEGRAVPQPEPAAMERVRRARAALEAAIDGGMMVYGATTGVGAMKDVAWAPDEIDAFNAGLVRAHHFGTGSPFPRSTVRTALAIRVNTALTGRVGCSAELVEAFVALLRRDVTPVVRRTGSIGCADIGLMGQIGAMLAGEGEAHLGEVRLPAAEALARAGLQPFRYGPRDALAALSVNAVGFAAASEAMRGAARVLRVLLATGLTTAGALGASRMPWRAVAHVGTAREAMIGGWMVENARGWDWPDGTQVQDHLSLRMMAQVYGVLFDSLVVAGDTLTAATGRTDDNPIVVEGDVLTSGGSLPLDVTVVLETLQIALAHMARNSFNRCVLLGNGVRRGLPVNLVPPGVVATGFGPIIKLAGELFTRCVSMTHPISLQSLVVAGGFEDEAAFLPLVVERVDRQVRALRRLAALESLLAAQAMDILGDRPGGVAGLVYGRVRAHAAFLTRDRPLSAEVEAVEAELTAPETLGELVALAPLADLDEMFALGPEA